MKKLGTNEKKSVIEILSSLVKTIALLTFNAVSSCMLIIYATLHGVSVHIVTQSIRDHVRWFQ